MKRKLRILLAALTLATVGLLSASSAMADNGAPTTLRGCYTCDLDFGYGCDLCGDGDPQGELEYCMEQALYPICENDWLGDGCIVEGRCAGRVSQLPLNMILADGSVVAALPASNTGRSAPPYAMANGRLAGSRVFERNCVGAIVSRHYTLDETAALRRETSLMVL